MIQGEDVIISKSAEIRHLDLCKIGNHVAIDSGFYCTTALELGDYVHISPHVAVIGGRGSALILEDFCVIGAGSKMVGGSELFLGEGLIGPFIPKEYHDTSIVAPVKLERFSGVMTNAVVMPGVTMAEGSFLGANSLLKESTEPWTIYAGNPARPIRLRPREKCYEYAAKMGYVYL